MLWYVGRWKSTVVGKGHRGRRDMALLLMVIVWKPWSKRNTVFPSKDKPIYCIALSVVTLAVLLTQPEEIYTHEKILLYYSTSISAHNTMNQ
jgi:hypothetical protein